jgi:hypothetical protein
MDSIYKAIQLIDKKINYLNCKIALKADKSESGGSLSLDTTNLTVVPFPLIQDFAEAVDHALLSARGTGVNTSYTGSTVNGGTTFTLSAVGHEIKSDQGYFHSHYAGLANVTVNDLTSSSVFVYIDNTNTLQQQTSIPTEEDWMRKVFVLRIGIDTTTQTILGFEYLNNPIGHESSGMRDIYDFLLAQGVSFKKDQLVTGRAGDLGFDVSEGKLLEFGGTGNILIPHVKNTAQVDNVSYTWTSQTAFVSSETNLLKYWDNAGTFTPLGSTTCVGHRLYRFSNGNFAMQAGQGNYANMVLCKAGVVLEEYVLNPQLKNATFFGWWLIQETAVNTIDTTKAKFVEYSLGMQGGSSNELSGALLKGSNLNDLTNKPQALINIGGTYRAVGVAITASANLENINSNTFYDVDASGGAIVITVTDQANTDFAIGSEWEFSPIELTNDISFVVAGSTSIESVDGNLKLDKAYSGAILKKVANNKFRLIGTLKA